MFNNLPCVLQVRMKNHPSFIFSTIILPTAYVLTAALSRMQLVATTAYEQLVRAQAEFDALALARISSTTIVPVHLTHAGFPPVPVVPAHVSQAETTMQRYQPPQQAPQRQHHPQPTPDLQHYQPPRHHHPQPSSAWPAPNWRLGEDPGPPPPDWQGCFYCFLTGHMFRNCPHRHSTDAVSFFHWYSQTHVPCLYASIQCQREEKRAACAPAAALAAVPVAVPAAAPAAVPAAAPVVSPTPRTQSRPSCTAYTFVTQISILETSADPPPYIKSYVTLLCIHLASHYHYVIPWYQRSCRVQHRL